MLSRTGGSIVVVAVLLSFGGVALAGGSAAPAGQGKALFAQDCSSCHTIGGGDRVGPDLKGITQTAGVAQVRSFIADPAKLISSGNPTITALVRKFHGVQMPSLGLSPAQVDALVAYLQSQAGAAAEAGAAGTTTAPSVAGNAGAGKGLFTGATQLANGGPACMSCHSIAGAGWLGGGRIGPDLTNAYTKYGGSKGIASVLASIPFPKMVPIYSAHPLTGPEQADLAAFLATTPGKPRPSDRAWLIVVLGGGGAACGLGLAFLIWPRRRLAVRKHLVPTTTRRA